MRGKIVVTSQDGNVQEIPMDRPTITIGRKPGNDLHFNRPEISGTHASFTLEDGQYYVTDLGSTNGTLLNGAQLLARQKYALQHKDVVTVAPYTITFLMEVETSETIVEMPGSIPEEPRVRSGTIVDPHARISTGTEENLKEDIEKEMAEMQAPPPPPAPAPDPKPEPAQPPAEESAPAPAPESAPEPEPKPEPPPKPKPKPAPKPAAKSEEPETDEEEGEPEPQVETKTALSDYAWLGIGALFLITAILLVVYVIVGL